jgi:hypothetical protein
MFRWCVTGREVSLHFIYMCARLPALQEQSFGCGNRGRHRFSPSSVYQISTSRQRRPPMEAEHSMYYYSPSAGNELSDEPSLDHHPYTQQSRSSTAFILHPTPKRFKSTSQECRGERGRYRNSIPRLPRRRIRRKEDKTPFYAKPFRCRETKRKYWKSQGKEDTATISWQRGSSTAHRNQPR